MKLKKMPYLLLIIVTICLITSCNKKCKHQSTYWELDKQATCTQNGSKHKECTVCHEKEDPTCTEKGHKAYETCTRCNYTTYEKLPATGHTESEWIIDKQATCMKIGSKHKECTVCHEKLDTEVIESLGHDLVHHEKEDPTCTNKGHKAYDICTRCDYTTYEEISELGHIYEDGICTRCGYELTSSDLLYELTSDNTGYLVTGLDYSKYDFNALTIIIPSEYKGLPIVGIEEEAFKNRIKIKKIILSNYITHIGNAAFEECKRIANIVLPNSVTSIGDSAFSGCTGLTSIEIPNSVITIGRYVFLGCSSLKSIIIPDSVTTMGKAIFENSTNLESVTIPFVGDGINNAYLGYMFGADSQLSNSEYVPSSLKEVIITKATIIDDLAFANCQSLKKVVIPDSVTTMGKAIFENSTNLESVTIPFVGDGKNNAYLGHMFGASNYDDNSQYVPISLKKVIITNVTSIGSFAFSGCAGLTSIVIPNSVTSIGESAFGGCRNLTNIEIPDSVTSIGNSAFDGCKSLADIEIPDSVTSIGCGAFLGCTNLTIIVLPNKIKNIGSDAFFDCISLTNVYYEGIIEDWCNISFKGMASNPMYYASHFYMLDKNNEYKEITEIVIPETITIIGNYQFYGFNYIKSIIIPNSVTSIGLIVFSGCTGLTSIIVNENNPIYDSRDNCNAIIETKTNTLIYGCNNTIIPNTVTTIERGAFYRCTGLTSIKIPNNVTNIGEFAFCGCASLTNIVISNSVTSIGMCAFDDCTSLTSIVIPDSVTSIGFYAFGNCTGLTIYCETLEQPSGWDDDWNPNICKVVWGYKK